MIRTQLFIGTALLVGVAIGYFLKPTPIVEVAESTEYEKRAAIVDAGPDATREALKRRIAELENRLAELVSQTGSVQVAEQARPSEPWGGRREPPKLSEMRARFEEMAKNDPVRYAQMTNRMAQFQRMRLNRAHNRLDFLESIDTSGMTAEQKKSHDAYQDLIVRREELEEKLHRDDLTDEDHADIMREMHETHRSMRELAAAERETLLGQMSKAIGLSDDDAAEVTATVKDIISATENGFHHGPPMGGPPPARGK